MPPLAGSILRAPCPSTAPLAGVLTLQQCCDTIVFHPALPSAFFLSSAQPQGFPDETEVRGALLSDCERQSTTIPVKGRSAEEVKKEAWDSLFSKDDKKNVLNLFIVEFVTLDL